MRKLPYVLLGLILAASVTAYGIQTGGFPYFPTFGALTVKNFLKCGNTGVAGRQCDLVGNGTGGTAVSYSGIVDQAGTRFGYYGKTSSGAADVSYESDAAVQVVANNGVDVMRIDTAHAYSFNGATVARAGFHNPKISFGEFIGNAGGCSNNSGVWQTQNMGGTCVRNSVGNYTITFSTAYAGSPICMAQITSALAGIAGVNTAGTTSVTVQVGTTAFAAQDAAFFVQCIGL